MLIDSHAHLNFPDYAADFDEVVARAREAGVDKIINIGTSLADSETAVRLAQKCDWMYATVGRHPNDSPSATVDNVDWEKLEQLAKSPKVVGIGECGLDYSKFSQKGMYVTSRDRDLQPTPSEPERQKKLFRKQIEIAQKLSLPLSIHIRQAQEDLREIFSSDDESIHHLSGVFHCFSGDERYVRFIFEKLPNFYISFAGNLTYKNSQPLRDLAKLVPLERLLVETDCPFLSPEGLRGKRNEPANVKLTAMKLAEVKGVSLEKIAKITTENAEGLFNI